MSQDAHANTRAGRRRSPAAHAMSSTVTRGRRQNRALGFISWPPRSAISATSRLRALATLAAADLIACEDTRVTRKLLDRYAIATPLTPYHDHNAATARPKLLRRLAEGAAIALVSDAGTPLISDPGYKLVRAAQEAGYAVTAIPGASSVLAALTVAGLPTDQFFFAGFLPPKQAARRARIAELARIPATLVLFETGPRIAATLADLAAGLGEREAAVCRELTKMHEEVRRGAARGAWRKTSATRETRGEFVLVIAPPPAPEPPSAGDADALLRAALARTSLKDAVGEVAVATGLPRRDALSARAGARGRERRGDRRWRAALSRSRPPTAPRRERVAAFRLGLSAESRAAMFLIAKGYRIVARRLKTPFGEIDIVARRRRALVFVEVKARETRRRCGRGGDRTRQAPHHRRRRALARPQSGRRAARNPLRRDAGDARQDTAAHPQRVRREPVNIGRWTQRHGGRRENCVELDSPTLSPANRSMPLNVAVQMDPIERINVRGDSTFALLLEAQRRGYALSYYTPDRLGARRQQGIGGGAAAGRCATRRRSFHARRAARDRPLLVRRRAAAPGPAVRSRLHLDDAHARAHPSEDARGQRSGARAQRAGKSLRHRVSRSDAADADHPRPRRHQGDFAPSTATSS